MCRSTRFSTSGFMKLTTRRYAALSFTPSPANSSSTATLVTGRIVPFAATASNESRRALRPGSVISDQAFVSG